MLGAHWIKYSQYLKSDISGVYKQCKICSQLFKVLHYKVVLTLIVINFLFGGICIIYEDIFIAFDTKTIF